MIKTLSEAVELEGYTLVLGNLEELSRGPNALRPLGVPQEGIAVCEGNIIVCDIDCWDNAYSVSHEIAEHRYNFAHSADMFAEQANILARWLRRRG